MGKGVGTPRVTHITLELILDKGLVKFIFTKGDKPNEKAVTFHFNSWLPDGSHGIQRLRRTPTICRRIDAAEAGSTIKLNENATITTPLNINKSITLDGNGYTLTYTGTGYAIQLNTNDAVTFDDLDLDACQRRGAASKIVSNKPNFKLNDSLWNVNNRGIGFGSNSTVAGATVTIDSSIIQDSKKA